MAENRYAGAAIRVHQNSQQPAAGKKIKKNRGKKYMKQYKLYSIYYTTLALGLGSQILFIIFLFIGPFKIIDFSFSFNQALLFDAGLSLLFFLQHSIIVRKSVKKRLSNLIDDDLYSAFYSNTSAAALIIMVFFWQTVPYTIESAGGINYWVLRVLFFISIAGFYWGLKSLDSFDPFGVSKIKRIIYKKEYKNKIMPMTVKGAYRWMRHPLYFFMLIMIWSYPELTADRLLFNTLWTVWIIIGTIMEERDLVSSFGEQYRKYQKKVPMIIPYKIPGSTDSF
jgi:protein-S-isoprenylcysteine O-methyltransferase Ste14